MKKELDELERAIYEMLEKDGVLTPQKSVLYKHGLASLVKKGLAERLPDGGHALIGETRRVAQEAHEVMATLTVRTPKSSIHGLDRAAKERGQTRSEFVRDLIRGGLQAKKAH